MVCYGPRAGTVTAAGIVGYALLHNALVRILHIVGVVMEIALITGAVAALTVLVAWIAQATSRRRAARGACTTCRFRCQRALSQVSPDVTPAAAAANAPPHATAGEQAGQSLLTLPLA